MPRTTVRPAAALQQSSRWAWLTRGAFMLMVALVIARATISERLHVSAINLTPGTDASARDAGPSTIVVLDLLCCLPALLVLSRRLLDRRYVLKWSWSLAIMGLLGLWMGLSVLWAADQYTAAISAFGFIGSLAILWTAAQTVRDWQHLRMVAAILFGILLIYGAWGVLYRQLDVPAMQIYWAREKAEILRQNNWEPGSFAAGQLEKNVVGGAMLGFYASPNTYAAATVLLMVVTLGILAQRLAEKDGEDWGIYLIAIAMLASGGWILWYAASKAAAVTSVLAPLLLGAVWRWRPLLARYWRRAFMGGLAAVVVGMLAVTGVALVRGNLISYSLTVRWQYWVGSSRLLAQHLLRGVGWANFGWSYLQVRLPVASEEIQDPHNFIVRFWVELGAVGGVLLLAWMVRLWWEMVRPGRPTEPEPSPVKQEQFFGDDLATSRPGAWDIGVTKHAGRDRVAAGLASIAVIGITINIAASLDFSSDPGYVIGELLKRLLYLGLLVIGSVVATLRSLDRPNPEPRPAPWLVYGGLIALGTFFLHGLIDFAWSETGPMYLVALLAGSVLGIRLPVAAAPVLNRLGAAGTLAAAMAGWIIALLILGAPTVQAEQRAQEAEQRLRAGQIPEAVELLQEAGRIQPHNADYPLRAAGAMAGAGLGTDAIRQELTAAMGANPLAVRPYLMRAELERRQADPKPDRILHDFGTALSLDPCAVSARLEFADTLAGFGLKALARDQYLKALEYDDLLEKANPKRLPATQRERIAMKAEGLKQASSR